MKRLSFLLLILFVFTTNTVFALPWPPDMSMSEIKFNYSPTSTTYDAITLKLDYSTNEDVPEWDVTEQGKIAYIKSQTSRRVKAKIRMDNRICDYNMGVKAEIISGTGIGDVNENDVYFEDSEYSRSTTFTCDGTVPDTVGASSFTWRWKATYIEETEFEDPILIDDTGPHHYYVVYGTPQSPMTSPWVPVLEYACGWASGESSATVIATEVTKGLYEIEDDGDDDIDWTGEDQYGDVGQLQLQLGDFLSDIVTYSNVTVNCSDMGNLFCAFTSALGLSSQSRYIQGGLYTAEIDPIGDETEEDWITDSWLLHQYGWYDSKAYDACLRIDKNGTPGVPVDLTQSAYYDSIFQSLPNYTTSTGTTTVIN